MPCLFYCFLFFSRLSRTGQGRRLAQFPSLDHYGKTKKTFGFLRFGVSDYEKPLVFNVFDMLKLCFCRLYNKSAFFIKPIFCCFRAFLQLARAVGWLRSPVWLITPKLLKTFGASMIWDVETMENRWFSMVSTTVNASLFVFIIKDTFFHGFLDFCFHTFSGWPGQAAGSGRRA